MGAYFKPLRWKIGVVTLVIACVFVVGWVRSVRVKDEISFEDGAAEDRIILMNGAMAWGSRRLAERPPGVGP